MMNKTLPILLIAGLLGCESSPKDNQNLTVTVSILPQKFIIDKISGNTLNVNVMLPPGANPVTFEPKPHQWQQLQDSKAYLTIGVHFESAWMDKISQAYPHVAILNRFTDLQTGAVHDHGDHDHGSTDPHIWLSPILVDSLARRWAADLSALNPDEAETYQAHYQTFSAELDTLHAWIQSKLKNKPASTFMVFHPSWGYFADTYGLTQLSIEIGGQEPSLKELESVIETAKANHIHTIISQPEFSQKAASVIAREIDGKVVPISPLSENWVDNMVKLTETIAGPSNE